MLFNGSPKFEMLVYGYDDINTTYCVVEVDIFKGYALVIPRKTITGWYLYEMRKLFGFSQKIVCRKLGITQAQYSKYENGKDQPSTEVLIRCAKIFTTSIDFISGNKMYDTILENEKDIYKKMVFSLFEEDIEDETLSREEIENDIDIFTESLKLINTKISHMAKSYSKTITIKKAIQA